MKIKDIITALQAHDPEADVPHLRLGIGYEQADPGLYVYDANTAHVVVSDDVAMSGETGAAICGALLIPPTLVPVKRG